MSRVYRYPIGTVLRQRDEVDGICVQKYKARVVGYAPNGDYRLEVLEEMVISKERLESDESPLKIK